MADPGSRHKQRIQEEGKATRTKATTQTVEKSSVTTDEDDNISNCGDCEKEVCETDKALECEVCENWYHIKCQKFPESIYDFMVKEEEGNQLLWNCKHCQKGSIKLHKRLLKLEEKQRTLEENQSKVCKEIEETKGITTQIITETKNKVLEVETSVSKVMQDINEHQNETKQGFKVVEEEIVAVQNSLKVLQDDKKALEDRVCAVETNSVSPTQIAMDKPNATGGGVIHKHQDHSGTMITEVMKEMEDRKSREKNIIVFGLDEIKSEDRNVRLEYDIGAVVNILTACEVKCDKNIIAHIKRLGAYDNSKKRPVLVVFKDMVTKSNLFKNIGKLQSKPEMKSVIIANDLTLTQRKQEQELLREAKNKTDSGLGKFKVRGPPWARRVMQIKQ